MADPAKPTPTDNPALEARVMALSHELRCLVCQNQSIAESNAELAQDLRRIIRDMLSAGRSEQDVRDFMAARYGDFVLYKPPLKTSTALLWAGPAVMLAAGGALLAFTLHRRRQLPASAFEPESPDEPNDARR
jgi:cytochrome c-type biogenesis protein CcmH